MHRYPIYLDEHQRELLARVAEARGCSMSDLVREAIETTFRKARRGAPALRILDQTFGAWGGRVKSGAAAVEKLRDARRWSRRLRALRAKGKGVRG